MSSALLSPFFLGHALDRQAVRLLRRRSVVDLELGEVLLALFSGDRLLRLGYAKQADYGRERLGLPPRTLRQFTRLARGLQERPLLRRAVAAGLVSPRKALLVMEVAIGEDEAGWTTAAARMTEKELKARVLASGGRPPGEPFDVETLLFSMKAEEQDRLDTAIRLARVVLGGFAPRWMALEAIAMEWAAGHGEHWPDDESSLRPERGALRHLSLPPADREDLPSDPRELDERACRLARERLSFDLAFGPVLRKIRAGRVYLALGYDTFEEYAHERLGLSIRNVRQRVWLERRMEELPELRAALADGTLTYTKALFVAKDATAADVAERITLAASTTWAEVERESTAREDRQNRAAGIRRLWGPKDAFETVSMAILCCRRLVFEREGRFPRVGEALAVMSDHFVAVWREEVERIGKRRSRKRREVLSRNGGLCAVPGCTRPAEHEHHILYRSRGGLNEVENRLGVCAAHHLRSIHGPGGGVTVTGRAGERLAFTLGTGERFVALGAEGEVRRRTAE